MRFKATHENLVIHVSAEEMADCLRRVVQHLVPHHTRKVYPRQVQIAYKLSDFAFDRTAANQIEPGLRKKPLDFGKRANDHVHAVVHMESSSANQMGAERLTHSKTKLADVNKIRHHLRFECEFVEHIAQIPRRNYQAISSFQMPAYLRRLAAFCRRYRLEEAEWLAEADAALGG